ncbi:SPOR domain-containing protein [Candidatus Albibeggiatoa sp. nov. NOAA]|uniref:SPOR domain-containing protein n=1 Tax=Candidatus Albibeggiatoa sp. nov. NOAA TaxID=3162724 RepID=UPI0033037C3B|nr:SPOR domain-containing protein [Thiotrichaceae bacterium]
MAEKREKRRIKRPRPEKQPIPRGCPPRWAWFFGGLLIGVFGAFLFYLYELAPRELTTPVAPTALTQAELAADADKPANALNYENYEFYSNLPKADVKVVETAEDVIEDEVETINALQAAQPATIAKPNVRLQVGSFRDGKIAQGLKNHLSTLGIQADVEQAVVNGLSWHRVRVGGFESEQALEQMKAKLTQQKIPFSVVE